MFVKNNNTEPRTWTLTEHVLPSSGCRWIHCCISFSIFFWTSIKILYVHYKNTYRHWFKKKKQIWKTKTRPMTKCLRLKNDSTAQIKPSDKTSVEGDGAPYWWQRWTTSSDTFLFHRCFCFFNINVSVFLFLMDEICLNLSPWRRRIKPCCTENFVLCH